MFDFELRSRRSVGQEVKKVKSSIKVEIPSPQAFTPPSPPGSPLPFLGPILRAGRLDLASLLPDSVAKLSKLLSCFDLRLPSDLNRIEIDGSKPNTVSFFFDLLVPGGGSVFLAC